MVVRRLAPDRRVGLCPFDDKPCDRDGLCSVFHYDLEREAWVVSESCLRFKGKKAISGSFRGDMA